MSRNSNKDSMANKKIKLQNMTEKELFEMRYQRFHKESEPTAKNSYVLPQKRRSASGLKRQHTPPSLSVAISKPQSNASTLPYASSLPVLDECASLPPTSPCSPNVMTVPKTVKSPPRDLLLGNESGVECAENPPSKMPMMYTQTLPPRIERRRENKKKFSKHKGRTDEIEEFKKFSSNFKLTDEKEPPDVTESKVLDSLPSKIERAKLTDKEEDVVKFSTLNPNAKEFVFNPNAKAFTPRSMPSVTPPIPVAAPPAPPPMQEQSPMMSQMIPQPIFTAMAPQYVMLGGGGQATPVSVAITSPFAAATPVPQPPPRFRKASGQPLLAPSGIPTPSQLTVQYSSPPGVIHTSAPTQPTAIGYPQSIAEVLSLSPSANTPAETPSTTGRKRKSQTVMDIVQKKAAHQPSAQVSDFADIHLPEVIALKKSEVMGKINELRQELAFNLKLAETLDSLMQVNSSATEQEERGSIIEKKKPVLGNTLIESSDDEV